MLEYKRIADTIQSRNYKLKNFIPQVADLTVQGFKKAIERKTLKLSALEEISKALNIKMEYWWKDDDDSFITPGNDLRYESILKKENQKLKKELDRKDLIIDDQLKTIKDLRNRIDNLEGKAKTKIAV